MDSKTDLKRKGKAFRHNCRLCLDSGSYTLPDSERWQNVISYFFTEYYIEELNLLEEEDRYKCPYRSLFGDVKGCPEYDKKEIIINFTDRNPPEDMLPSENMLIGSEKPSDYGRLSEIVKDSLTKYIERVSREE